MELFSRERASPLQTFDFIKGLFSSNLGNKLSNKLLLSYLPPLCLQRWGSPRGVHPAVRLKTFWLKHWAIKIDLDSDSFFHLSFTHLFALVKCPFTHFTTWLITCCCFQFIVFFDPPFHGVLFTLHSTCIRRRDKCGCYDTRGSLRAQWNAMSMLSPAADRQAGPEQADLSPPNLSSMLIIYPTYSALPMSLHRKLTFLFFSLPLPPLSVPFLLHPFLFMSLVLLRLAANLFMWKLLTMRSTRKTRTSSWNWPSLAW